MEERINTIKIDNILSPTLNEVKRNLLELQIYFNEKDHSKFAEISENLDLINGKLQNLYFSGISVSEKSKEFLTFRDEKLLENTKYFKDIADLLKKTFK